MTADSRSPATPLAIRITRPYATEEEFLDHELDTLSRAGITLLGAQQRAEGVVLRFELVLTGGQVLVRGEGRVIGFKANAHRGIAGLSLRFTRLDTRSKALIDKAAALREKRRPSMRPPSMRPPSIVPPGSPFDPGPLGMPRMPSISPAMRVESLPPLPATSRRPSTAPGTVRLDVGTDRDALLGRLRDRARALTAEAVQEILERGRNRAKG